MSQDAIVGLSLLGGFWVGTALVGIKFTRLRSWLKYLWGISLFPLLVILVLANVLLSNMLVPALVRFVGEIAKTGASARSIAPFAFLVAAPIPLAFMVGWSMLLGRLDAKCSKDRSR